MPIKLPVTEQVPNKSLPGVLVSPAHDRLMANIDQYAQQANIAKEWFWKGTDDLAPDLLDWTKNFKFHGANGKHGLIVWGGLSGLVDDQFNAMCGLLSRNFIWGRCMTLMEFVEHVEDGDVIAPSCTLVSNLFVAKSKLPDWQLHVILDGLKQRGNHGKMTVGYVDDEKALKTAYGDTFHQYLRTKYVAMEF